MKKWLSRFYLAIIFVFLYAPILTLIVLSFNDSKFMSTWTGFSLRWYQELFESALIMEALRNTLLIAFLSALIATVLGTIACIGINQLKSLPKSIFMGLNNIPMINAEIVTGISLMLVFIATGMTLGFKTILIGHITFNVPYVVLSVMPKLKQTEKSTYEAAMDLGASPLQAFFKVIFPDILPGILSGFLLSFTMSLDDFVITHFVRGTGINTLSTLIYSEVRKGVRPSLYALSAIIFVVVFVLLLIVNLPKKEGADEKEHKEHPKLRKAAIAAGALCMALLLLVSLAGSFSGGNQNVLRVYNWGEYIDEDVITMFEEETGIDVIYDTYETNEEMYPIIEAGGVSYDAICPSDYMIEKMIANGLLQEIDMDGLENLHYIDETIWKKSQSFDPENRYSVPYTYGVLGILYNKDLVDEPVDSWAMLWNEDYKGEILTYNSIRDLFTAPLKYLGYSLNTMDREELAEATDLLIYQKPLLQKYVVDQIKDTMVSNGAALAMSYSGEYLALHEENESLAFAVPKEGSNFYIDSWVIPANAENKENAEKWIDFLNRPDIALKNFEYITYSTPNLGAYQLIDEEIQNDPAVFPDAETLANCEAFHFLDSEGDALYNEHWLKVKDH